jgi:hypothetical protein
VRHQRFAGHLPRPVAKAGSVEPAIQRASRVVAALARP